MKKVLLTMVCLVAFTIVKAQPTVTGKWTKSEKGIISAADINNSNPIALSAQGEMYATGLFTENFSFGGMDLEALATSAYLLKYDANGEAKWGVALTGAATITAITTDETGNVYIAGNFADVVSFGSTDGVTIEKEGLKQDGTSLESQSAGFIAKYDTNGVVKSVQTFLPEGLPDLVEEEYYLPEDGQLYFNINKLLYDGKLYASALMTGRTTNNGFTFDGSYSDPWGGLFFIELSSSSIFSLNESLEVDGIIALMRPTPIIMEEVQYSVESTTFTVSGGKLYTGFVATGRETLTIGTKNESIEMHLPGDGDNDGMGFGYILSEINLSDMTAVTKKYEEKHTSGTNRCNIKSMIIKEDALILSGSFNGNLAFDTQKSAVGASDLYMAGLNKNTLDVTWTAVSGIDEGEITQKEEIFKGATFVGDYIYMIGYTADIASHVAETPLAFWVKATDGTITNANPANVITGVVSSDDELALAEYAVENDEVTNSFSLNTIGNGDSLSSSTKDAGVSVYPNPVVDELNFTSPCDVVITNLVGITVKQAENVINLNVADLAGGHYLVKVSTDEGTNTVKVIKK